MAKVIAVAGESGTGKTTSLLSIHDGTGKFNSSNMLYINADKKDMPFKGYKKVWNKENKNYLVTSNIQRIKDFLLAHSSNPTNYGAVIDTCNAIMLDWEMGQSKSATFNQWYDLAKDIYELIQFCNTEIRDDYIVAMMFHIALYTDTDGNERKCIVTNGRKLEKIKLESTFTTVLFTDVEYDADGNNEYYFITQSKRSTGKSPLGMFEEVRINNDLNKVLEHVAEYYEIEIKPKKTN